jgi:lysophospholipase L1-like esterase
MRITVRFLFIVVAALLAAPVGADETAKPQPAAIPARLELADGDGIVFLGDSITHQCLYTQYVEDYFYTRSTKVRLRFHNSGVGGDRCSDALLRFDRDVAAYKPKYVTILLGMNDGGVRPYDEATFQTYKRDMHALLERITGIGATPILITPTMFDSRASRALPKPRPPEALEFYNATLAYYGAWLRETASERGLRFVDMYSPLNNFTFEARKRDPAFTLIRDAVHPDAPGQVVMAYALLMDLGVPRRVSTISLVRGDDKPTVKATGAKVTDVRFSSDGVEFDVAAESLPLALPAAAEAGVKLVNLGHRLGQESLDVHGLEPGRYQLLIDDAVVGVFTHEQLERHVELQANPATPQYQQALAVAELNRRRNDEAMRPLRDLWRQQKLLRTTKEQAGANPTDAKLREQATALEAKLADMEEQLARLEASARKIEDEIFAVNQPPVRHYRLTRVK